jgi:hypothetical protein
MIKTNLSNHAANGLHVYSNQKVVSAADKAIDLGSVATELWRSGSKQVYKLPPF